MTPTYTWTHTPDPATLRRDLMTTQESLTVSPTFAATCANTAAEFRMLAQHTRIAQDEVAGQVGPQQIDRVRQRRPGTCVHTLQNPQFCLGSTHSSTLASGWMLISWVSSW